MDDLVTIRDAEDGDLATLTAYSSLEGMGPIDAAENVRVAVSDDGDIVGFIRLVQSDEGIWHVNPVVVYSTWRGFGVGRLLMDQALADAGELRLVSRGSSLAFYQSLGFEPIDWEAIHAPIVAECEECDLFDECGPVPMAKKL